MNKNYVSLYKSGKFYNAFGDDGLILHHLIGYKFVEYKQSVGFPESAFGKVKSLLDDVDISYKVYDKDILIEEKKGNNKKYNKVLSEALKKYDLELLESVLNKYGYDLSVRAEALDYKIFVEMANTLYKS